MASRNMSAGPIAAVPQPDEAHQAFLSLNPEVTSESALAQLAPGPLAEELDLFQRSDPQLPCRWVIWEQHVIQKDKRAGYSDTTRESASFSTVKEFWGCWNHLPQPSELLSGKKFVRGYGASSVVVDSLMVFREGVRPQWEHPANVHGGHFQLQLKPELGGGVIDELWNNIVLSCVAGLLEPPEMITGLRLVDRLSSAKPAIRVEVWFDDMDENDTGRLYRLKGNLERLMATGPTGEPRPRIWGYTEKVAHSRSGGKR
jgi:translation initiation factor 4E